VPEEWPFAEARELFLHPDVLPASECDVRAARLELVVAGGSDAEGFPVMGCMQFKWKVPDVEALVEFMVKRHGFQCVWALRLTRPTHMVSGMVCCVCAAEKTAFERVRKS
jgi:hypothetical protein